ncbi:hypothetical protein EH230_12140 [Flavobacterium columnare]|uniref:Type I restriction modification DNA specificity domain-containing protein n=1 Tax=Flavobacterium columnare TaxID=996 RepID=A0A437UDF0_9FLAO|nr:restriction endonuclease subunit S [Flavobacterium columnare]RVU91589.1 hypothetical protein EH230_12140 [Flavobacterium columnare]
MLSKIDLGDRFDAEFFEKDDLNVEKRLKELKSKELRNYGKFVASAFYPAATQLYEIGDTPFIRCLDCVKFPIVTKEQDKTFEKIPLEFVEKQSGVKILLKGDIVITKVGTPSYASIVYEHEMVALSRTVLGIQNIKKINKYYLLAFLRSKYGFSQLQRHRELTIQYQLTLERTKKTLIYEASQLLQINIEKLIHKFIDGLNKSKNLYTKAETLLLQEIGFNEDLLPSKQEVTGSSPDWITTSAVAKTGIEPNVNVKSFKESFGITGRLDAEYYQKKYEAVVEKIKSQKYDILQNIVKINKSIEPGSNYYSDDASDLPFIRVSDYNKFGLSEPNKKLTSTFVNEIQDKIDELKPKKGTILFSKDGSVGTAYHLRENLEGVTSSAILHLKVKDEKQVIPEYLTLVLNSKLVQMQAERDAGGSIILHWRVGEIQKVVVPIIDYTKQQEIAQLIEESFSLKKQSEQLLEIAKKAVEIAIEENEEVAMAFINTNTI